MESISSCPHLSFVWHSGRQAGCACLSMVRCLRPEMHATWGGRTKIPCVLIFFFFFSVQASRFQQRKVVKCESCVVVRVCFGKQMWVSGVDATCWVQRIFFHTQLYQEMMLKLHSFSSEIVAGVRKFMLYLVWCVNVLVSEMWACDGFCLLFVYSLFL